jgi:hypothetical protein
MITLLFLDDYHVGDPLFLSDLGRRLSKLGPAGRTLIVHRASEQVEKALEGAAEDDRDEIVERTIRETNQGVTRRLIEEGVPAVSVQGSDRPLLKLAPTLSLGSTRWLIGMVDLGSVAVISPLAESDEGVKAVDPAEVAYKIAQLVVGRDVVQFAVFCSTRKEGLFRDGTRIDQISVTELRDFGDIVDIDAATRLVQVANRTVVTNSVAIAKGPPLPGTVVSIS